MKVDLLLKNGLCITWCESSNKMIEKVSDIAIKDGRIFDFGPNLSYTAVKISDMTGLCILPGCIDTQVHFREPGLTHKEDLESGTRAALFGGITAIFEMPNTNPGTTTWEAYRDKLSRAQNRCHTHYAFYIGATPDNFKTLAEIEKDSHCPGVKVFMGSSTGSLLVDDNTSLENILKHTTKPIIVHAEDEQRLVERKPIALEAAHPKAHPLWRDETSALNATTRIINLARNLNRRVHILHVTTTDEMKFLASNKDIATVEVLPQHLTLTAPECYEKLGTLSQMNPPIRDKQHQTALWQAVNDFTVDVLGSDHAPHTLEEKSKPYPQSPSGMPGVQTILPLILTHAIDGKLQMTRAVELMTEGPRRVFKIKNKGRIQKDFDADLTVIKLNHHWTLHKEDVQSKCAWSPFEGFEFKVKVEQVYLNGELKLEKDKLLGSPSGQAVCFESSN